MGKFFDTRANFSLILERVTMADEVIYSEIELFCYTLLHS